jgi:hypothetical protein
MRRAAAALVSVFLLCGCSRQEAAARLKQDLAADSVDIIHARFPCRAPGLHFLKGEFSDGDVCWNFSTRQWSWRILPGQSLSRLNPRE